MKQRCLVFTPFTEMAHKSYQSTLPTHNKLLQKRWDQQRYDTHRQKVRSASSIVDSSAPRAHPHIQMKLKKQQVEEERLAIIERDNRTLLEKMSHIMRSSGRTENSNDYEHKSLNKEKREREQLRVAAENKGILTRLQAVRPLYSKKRWEDDFQTHEDYLQLVTTYPLEDWPTTSRHVRTRSHPAYSVKMVPRELPPIETTKKEDSTERKKPLAATAPVTGSKDKDKKKEKEKEKKAKEKERKGKDPEKKGKEKERDGQKRKEGDASTRGAAPKKEKETDANDGVETSKVEAKEVKEELGNKETSDEKKASEEKKPTAEKEAAAAAEKEVEEDESTAVKESEPETEKKEEKEEAVIEDKVQEEAESENKEIAEESAGDAKKEEEDKNDQLEVKSGVEADVEAIRASIEAASSGEIVDLLKVKKFAYREELASQYKKLHEKELSNELKSAFDGSLGDALAACVRTQAEVNAWSLHEAISSVGTKERVVVDVLSSLTNQGIEDVKATYSRMYDKDLAEQLKCETSGDFESLILDLCHGKRQEGDDVDEEMADKEAKELFEAGEGKWGTNEGTFIKIIASRSRKQLQATFVAYEKIAGKTITSSLENETSGDLLLGLKAAVLLADDQWKYWSLRAHESIEKGQEGQSHLIRITLATSEESLALLRGKYQEIYSSSLPDAVKEAFPNELGDLLSSLLGH